MKYGIPVLLSVVNLGLLVWLLAVGHPNSARADADVLRGRALQIVDEQGRVRASLGVLPVTPKDKSPDGKEYPETVLLRLIDPNGRPSVKLGSSVKGGSLGLGGADDPTYIQVIADDVNTFVRLTNHDGKQQLIKP